MHTLQFHLTTPVKKKVQVPVRKECIYLNTEKVKIQQQSIHESLDTLKRDISDLKLSAFRNEAIKLAQKNESEAMDVTNIIRNGHDGDKNALNAKVDDLNDENYLNEFTTDLNEDKDSDLNEDEMEENDENDIDKIVNKTENKEEIQEREQKKQKYWQSFKYHKNPLAIKIDPEMHSIYATAEPAFENNIMHTYKKKRWLSFRGGMKKKTIAAIHANGAQVYVCGLFDGHNGSNVACLDTSKHSWDYLEGGVDNLATCLVFDSVEEVLYLGGVFKKAGSKKAYHVVSFHTKTREWKTLGDGLDSECCTLVLNTNTRRLYAGGTFMHSGNTRVPYMAVWDIESKTWGKVSDEELNGPCRSLAMDQNNLYVGGLFTAVNELELGYVAKYNVDTKEWDNLEGGIQGYCNSLCFANKCVYIGGTFTSVGLPHCRIVTNNIAGFHVVSRNWFRLNGGVDGVCNTICHDPITAHIFVGGTFLESENIILNRIAKFDGEQWCPLQGDHVGLDGNCKTLFLDKRHLYAGGSFQNAGGNSVKTIVRYSVDK